MCLDNFATGGAENVQNLLSDGRFKLVRCDVTDYIHVPRPVDLVVHMASPASPRDYLGMPVETLKAGSIGTLHALGLAKEKGAKFVVTSTSEVYGDPQVHPQPESYWGHVNPIGPRSVYDEAKRFAEALTMAYRRTHGVTTGIVRIFNTYGPRMRPGDGRAIPNFIRQALTGEPLTVAGDGQQTRSMCYVDDLIEGLFRMLGSDEPGPVNLGSDQETTVLQVAERVRALCGSSSEIRFVGRPADDPGVRRPDLAKARAVLGWQAGVSLDDGLLRTIAWFREREDLRSGDDGNPPGPAGA